MQKWEKIASDYYCNFWKNYMFVRAAAMQPDLIGMPQVYLAVRGYPKTIDYLYTPESWESGHKYLSKLTDDNIFFVGRILDETVRNGETMNNYTERFIKDDLSLYSSAEIFKSYKKHFEYNCLEYAWGIMIPYLDFQSAHYIEDRLKLILNSKLKDSKTAMAFAIFTQPIEDSFSLEQEKSILGLYRDFPDKKLLSRDPSEILAVLESNHFGFYKRFQEHAGKYAWIYYVYSGPAAAAKDFVETLKFYAKRKINPVEKLNELNDERENILNEREELFSQMNLGKEEEALVKMAAKIVFLKPRRKDYQSRSYYHLEFLQKEIGRRVHMSLTQVRSCLLEEVEAALLGKKINIDKINSRAKFHVIFPDKKKIQVHIGKQAEDYAEENIKEEDVKVEDLRELIGQPAYVGRAKGVVRRIDMPDDMRKMNEGDVLVSTATTPSIVPAIRKAAAIITDEGGLTCHAAIVSREFKIPCVTGVKIATKVLQDGDLVEVNADEGIIKIIKKYEKQ